MPPLLYPSELSGPGDWPAMPRADSQTPGVSFREWAAVQIAAGLAAASAWPFRPQVIAGAAISLADELAKQLLSPPGPDKIDIADLPLLGVPVPGDDGRAG